MSLVSHVLRRGAIYHFRVRVPDRLRGKVGRNELWRSLRTADPAEARRHATDLCGLTQRLWRDLARAMTPSDAKVLVDNWLLTKLDEDADIRDIKWTPDRHRAVVFRKTDPWRPDDFVRTLDDQTVVDTVVRDGGLEALFGPDEFHQANMSDLDIARFMFMKPFEYASANLMGDDDTIAAPLVRELFTNVSVEVDEKETGFKAGVRFMMRALNDLQRTHWKRRDADWRRWSGDDPAQELIDRLTPPTAEVVAEPPPQAAATSLPTPTPASSAEPSGVKLTDASEDHIAEALSAGGFKLGRAKEVRSAVKTFIDWLGRDPDLTDVTGRLAGDFRKDMAFYPKGGATLPAYRMLSVRDRIAKSRASTDPTPLDPGTVNGNYMDPLRGVFAWGTTRQTRSASKSMTDMAKRPSIGWSPL